MWTVLKITCGLVAAYAIWHALPASADPYPGSHVLSSEAAPAKVKAKPLHGSGPFLIINSDKVVVGVVQDGVALAVTPTPQAPGLGTVDNPATVRLQMEHIETNPHIEWDCPRGMKVLRYGVRGC